MVIKHSYNISSNQTALNTSIWILLVEKQFTHIYTSVRFKEIIFNQENTCAIKFLQLSNQLTDHINQPTLQINQHGNQSTASWLLHTVCWGYNI